jgi:predicted dehydrogenase/threonine dehydrogenase-like Zn-dependent dehydrogenase
MKQVVFSAGEVRVEEVARPTLAPGAVLVRVAHSCISVGTESAGIAASGKALWRRAVEQPAKVRMVIDMAMDQGIRETRRVVAERVTASIPTGYSVAGEVVEVGAGVAGIRVGDLVGAGGSQWAFHAELVAVPKNLVVPVPEGLDLAEASTVTLGAIALQGVRRLQPTLGEVFVVLGLGLLGQITVQLLRAAGCRVIGADPDAGRMELARAIGMEGVLLPQAPGDVSRVQRLTGAGADGVIITASSASDEIVSSAFGMCRKKGRVVLVGDVGLQLNRGDFFEKELDFLISSSYGPGRYDRRYEEEGLDYPLGYVRWTERRNMEEYLRLLSEGKIELGTLPTQRFPLDDAKTAFAVLKDSDPRPLMVFLDYPVGAPAHRASPPPPLAVVPAKAGRIGIAVIGAGAFARSVHLPNIAALDQLFSLRAVVGGKGHAAAAAAKQFGASYTSADLEQILDDESVDAVLIATRHHLHQPLALACLERGKHVLVEKPLALTQPELEEILRFYSLSSMPASLPLLQTGFNRRFSPYAQRLRDLIRDRTNPVMISYRMNAGYIPSGHWTQTAEGGGRNIGEACHIYDLFTFLIDRPVLAVSAHALRPASEHYREDDNFVATLTFDDGSVASLTYTALGTPDSPKERLELFSDGQVAHMDDYRSLEVWGRVPGLKTKHAEKGHREELEAFAGAIQGGGSWPIPAWQQEQAMMIAFRVQEALFDRS